MRRSMRDADVQAAVIDAYRQHGVFTRAAAAAGVSPSAVGHARRSDADFAARLAEVRAGFAPLPKRQVTRVTAAARQAFLDRLAATGNVVRAAAEAGVPHGHVWRVRRHDADFAAAWAAAKNQALDRVEDVLFDAVLDGFRRTETVNGVTRVIIVQNANAMFKLLARRAAEGHRYKTIELTPTLLAEARTKIERRIRVEAGERAAQMALPAPTETAA